MGSRSQLFLCAVVGTAFVGLAAYESVAHIDFAQVGLGTSLAALVSTLGYVPPCLRAKAAARVPQRQVAASATGSGRDTAALGSASATRPLRPNIVWVMADDLGVGEVGLLAGDSPHGRIATPNLDDFGREGMVFTDAYSGYTVCAPSRTAFFTGRHSGHFKRAGLNGRSLSPDQGVTTTAQILQQAGYATGAFGKIAPLTDPEVQGFDVFIGQVSQALCHNMYPIAIDSGREQLNFKLIGNTGEKNRSICMADPARYNWTIDVFHEEAMKWLGTVAHSSKPFFLYLSFTVPHAGGWADAPDWPEPGAPVPSDLQYANEAWPDIEKDHAAVITHLDAKVGDLLKRLHSFGIDDNTLVIFASDNGAHIEGGHNVTFFNSTAGLRGHKCSLFDGGTRTPTMARWPGKIPAGSRSDLPWAFWDVLPTFAELAGASVPAGLDGISIVPTLMGGSQAGHEYLYWTWKYLDLAPGYGVRSGKWKGIVPSCTSANLVPTMKDEMLLFDLDSDPFEKLDVADRNLEVVHKLKGLVMSGDVTCDCFQC